MQFITPPRQEHNSPRDPHSPHNVETGEDDATCVIYPSDDVYSYFLFISPLMSLNRRKGRIPWRKYLAILLVFFSLVLQCTLTYAIYRKIVLGDHEWRLSVVGSPAAAGSCTNAGSLCTIANGTYSCAPPSVRLAGKWEELDTNGDGIWTREEVEAAQEQLLCKYAVDAVEVFDVFLNYLTRRQDLIWLHPDVKSGQAIHRPYFQYAAGDIIMCGYRTTDMCVNLLVRGVFDAPLSSGLAPRVGETIESALKYCRDLLEDGGSCDTTLPSTYTVWKKSSQDQCLSADYGKVVYTHPKTQRKKSLLQVDYEATQSYERADKSVLFMMYQACVVVIFFLALFLEMKHILPLFTLVLKFPRASTFGDQAVMREKNSDGDVSYKIQGITREHRITMMFIVIARTIVLLLMACVGVVFLLKTTSYLDLVLNGLGVLFIVELANTVYTQMLSPYLQEEVEQVKPMEVQMISPGVVWNRNRAFKDILWAIIIVVTVVVCMVAWKNLVVQHVTTALKCACLSSGPTCQEAEQFSPAFWEKYWDEEVPAIYDDVLILKSSSKSTSLLDQSAGSVNMTFPYGSSEFLTLEAAELSKPDSKTRKQLRTAATQ